MIKLSKVRVNKSDQSAEIFGRNIGRENLNAHAIDAHTVLPASARALGGVRHDLRLVWVDEQTTLAGMLANISQHFLGLGQRLGKELDVIGKLEICCEVKKVRGAELDTVASPQPGWLTLPHD